jgi:GTP-binding protein
MVPKIAIVGRPNVGKSTLFNRLLQKQAAIVADRSGVTRDRHYADARIGSRLVTLVDTGGFDPKDDDPLHRGIARGVIAAIAQAQCIVCVLDAQSPPIEADHEAVKLLRRAAAEVVYFANRADNPKQEQLASDLYLLGVERLIVGSALHGRNTAALERSLLELLPKASEQELALSVEQDDEAGDMDAVPKKRVINLALIGRPNAGKSSLLNRLAKEERSLVDERPGTTRDPVDALIKHRGREYRVVDTAGVRRKARVHEAVEAASVMRAIAAMSAADAVVLLCDASEGVAEQESKLMALASDRGLPVVVGLNKMDLLPSREQKEALATARDAFHFASWVPIHGLSVRSGRGVSSLMRTVQAAHAEYTRRIGTAELNRFLKEVVDRTPPPSKAGRIPKIHYLTQARTAPPLFVAMCPTPQAIAPPYRRFIENQLRSAFDFSLIPLRPSLRANSESAWRRPRSSW